MLMVNTEFYDTANVLYFRVRWEWGEITQQIDLRAINTEQQKQLFIKEITWQYNKMTIIYMNNNNW